MPMTKPIRSRAGKTALKALAATLLLGAAAACASPEQKVERYTKSGYAYLEKGDTGRANVEFMNALKINESYVPALLGASEVAEKKQNFNAVYGILENVVRLDPNNTGARVKLGKLQLIGGDNQMAMDAADAVLKLKPDDIDATALKAAIYLKLDDRARAVELARKVVAKDPKNAEAVAVLATERFKAGDAGAAIAEIDRAIKLDEKQAVLHLLRLQFLQASGRTDEMVTGFKRLIALHPDVVQYRQLLVRQLIILKRLPEAREQIVAIAGLSKGDVNAVLDVVRIDTAISGLDAGAKTFKTYAAADPKNIELQFAYAGYLRQLKKYPESDAIYQTLVKNKEEGVVLRARNEIAAQFLVQNKISEGRAIVDDILKKDPRNTQALIKRAGLRIDEGKFDDAITDLRTAGTDDPDSIPVKVLTATAFERKGNLEFAKTELAQAAEQSKFDPEVANIYAKLLLRTNDAPRAKEVLEKSLETHSSDLENLKLLAATQLMQQDWRGAETTAKAIESANAADPSVDRILGAAYAGLQDFPGVIKELGDANQKAPLTGQPLTTLVEAYVKGNRAGEAETLLRGMIEKNPRAYDATVLLAQVLDAQQKTAEIEPLLRAAYAIDKTRPEALEKIYRVLRRENRDAEVAAFLDSVIKEAPENTGALYLKADLLITAGQKEAAIAIYDAILAKRPNDLVAANNYASLITEVRTDADSFQRALTQAKKLTDAQNPYLLDTLGWAQFKTGDVAGARATLIRAVGLVEGFAEGHYHLAEVYAAGGEKGLAEAEARKALAALAKAPNPDIEKRVRALLEKL